MTTLGHFSIKVGFVTVASDGYLAAYGGAYHSPEIHTPGMRIEKTLTPREREVLKLVGQGKTSKQIADILNLSVFTVSNHRKHICRKLGVHSTAQLVAFAVKHNGS
jgi:DNA-binding CsgD family transcriptional regulator